jgi:hypothetical protein
MVTNEGLRLCSFCPEPLTMVPLLTIAGAPAGTAGGATSLPLTGDIELDLTCCAGPPTMAGGLLDAMAGPMGLPLVAVAYEERAKGGVPEAAPEAVCAAVLGVVAVEGSVLVIR